MAKPIVGINCTKTAIYVAVTKGSGDDFQIISTDKLEYSIASADDLRHLHHAIKTYLSACKDDGARKIAILKSSAGPRGSSVDSIKAEGILELIATSELGMTLQRVTPQSLPGALEANGAKWQARAKELFNPDGNIKYWANGTNGAVAAAYKALL